MNGSAENIIISAMAGVATADIIAFLSNVNLVGRAIALGAAIAEAVAGVSEATKQALHAGNECECNQ